MTVRLNVNGSDVELEVERDTPLLYVLRNDLGLNSPKFGCGLAQCGSCTVLINGQPMRSCITTVASVVGREVVTLEGLGSRDAPHPLQTAFIESQAMQCGYCANGIMMSAAALLQKNPNPSEQQIQSALDGNLCRCGTHSRIVAAISKAAESYEGQDAS